MAQPVIAYPGAKWRFYKYIKPYIPRDIKDWREPFFGGGSMSLSIADDPDFKLERMVVGDLAPEIWAMWTGCRDYPEETIGVASEWMRKWCPHQPEFKEYDVVMLRKIADAEEGLGILNTNKYSDTERAEWAEGYRIYLEAMKEARAFWKWAEEVDCTNLSIPERAARTFLVNRISFSGMGDSGTLSRERYHEFHDGKLNRIREASPLLKKMEIKNVSFEETMKDVGPDSFVFLDPPYYKQESSGLYGRNGDTHKGFPHEKFAEITKNTNCKWFVTYDDSVKVRKMFKGRPVYGDKCYITPFSIPGGYTMAQVNSEDALAGEEVFITNYDINQDDEEELLDF